MELLYIYIKNYKGVLVDTQFNLSPNESFYFDVKTNELKLEFSQENVPEHFFGNRISNLTSIVGDNGVGKSTFISFLLEALVHGKDPIDGKFLSIWRDGHHYAKVSSKKFDVNYVNFKCQKKNTAKV